MKYFLLLTTATSFLTVVGSVGMPSSSAAQNSDTEQGVEYVKANYTKFEYRIPMRDGRRLYTAVYVPKDQSKQYPILLSRTPYSLKPYGVDQYRSKLGPSELFMKDGYIVAYQDVRGRWMSEGEYVNVRPHRSVKKGLQDIDESTDTWDTVDWLLKNIRTNNGKVGIWGISYPGFYTAAGIIDAHPAIVAASPQAPVTNWFLGDDWHHNGAFFLAHCFNFMSRFGHPRPEPTKTFDHTFDYETPDAYQFFLKLGPLSNIDDTHFKGNVAFWNTVMRHGTYDEFWTSRNISANLRNIRPAVMTVGGWFDAENVFGALECYKHMEANSPNQPFNALVMGPWRHGHWASTDGESLGDIPFNSKTAVFYREKIEFPFFQYFLKGKGELTHPEAWVFITGLNEWRQYDQWPPEQARPQSLYFDANGRLASNTPDPGIQPQFDEYLSDPGRPVPYMNIISTGMTAEYMIADQRFASMRPDVLVYQTDILENDLSIAGPIKVDLTVSTSGTASDWVVKLIDVYPNDYPNPEKNPKEVRMGGYQQLVRGEPLRGRFRNSFENPEPFTPNRPARVRFTMPDTCHTFRAGHRVMVQVQSSWFPLVDRNPQTYVDIYTAKKKDFQKATQRVYRSGDMPSRIELLVMP